MVVIKGNMSNELIEEMSWGIELASSSMESKVETLRRNDC